jgi:hypothetical protein
MPTTSTLAVVAALMCVVGRVAGHVHLPSAATLTSVTPSSFPTTGGTELTVSWTTAAAAAAPRTTSTRRKVDAGDSHQHGRESVSSSSSSSSSSSAVSVTAAAIGSGVMVCRIASAAGQPAFTHAGYGTASVHTFPASAVNATAVRCVTPSVISPGNGVLDVSLDGGATWEGNPLPVRYFKLVDAAVGRRPYLDETSGEVLLATDVSLRGQTVSVVVELYLSGRDVAPVTLWGPGPTKLVNDTTTLIFPLASLPATVSADMRVTVWGFSVPGTDSRALLATPTNVTVWRRFQRAPPSGMSPSVVPSVVDHATRSLRVGVS